MKKLSKKSFMLFVGVLSVCAFAVPAVASAATLHPFHTTHLLDSSNPAHRLSFSVPGLGAGSTCAEATFDVDILTFDAVITSALFRNCMGTGLAVNCTVTPVATRLPWTVTPLSTTNITIDGVHVDAFFENTPGSGTACALPGNVTLTGSLAGGIANNGTHEIVFNAGAGTTAHTALGPFAATVTGTLRDTQQTLIMTD